MTETMAEENKQTIRAEISCSYGVAVDLLKFLVEHGFSVEVISHKQDWTFEAEKHTD